MKENRKFTIDIGVNAGQVSSTIKSLTRELVDLKETGKQAGNLIQNQRQLIKNRSNLEANLKNAEKVYNDTLAKYASYNLNGRDFAKELQNIKVKYDPIKNIRNVGKKNFSKIREELSDSLYFEIFGGNYDFDYKGKKKLAESIYSLGGKYNGNLNRKVELLIAKHRAGQTGTVNLLFKMNTGSFDNYMSSGDNNE